MNRLFTREDIADLLVVVMFMFGGIISIGLAVIFLIWLSNTIFGPSACV